jgi:PPOX class probable F420-dependent enzyme
MIPPEVRELLEAPNYVHLSTLKRDGTPRNWVVWAGLEGERVLICTTTYSMKATHMQRDPRVGLSVSDLENPYRMASLQGRVVEVRDDEGCRYMDRDRDRSRVADDARVRARPERRRRVTTAAATYRCWPSSRRRP